MHVHPTRAKDFEHMRRKTLVIAMILVTFALAFAGCNGSSNYDGKTKIVYELEGGSYKNCTAPIVQYYDFAEDTQNLIYSPQTLSRAEVQREGFRFTGWFKNKTQEGNRVVYSDEWDFENNKVTTQGVTLYAGWKALVSYTYNVCYVDENDEVKSLGVYEVNENDEFDDISDLAETRPGNYTPFVYKKDGVQVGYYKDRECTESIVGFKHPGGETDCQIDVYVKYIEGRYALVSTASQLTSSLGRNIYLLNDIDLGGRAFRIASYTNILEGNGHKIYNFTIPYLASKNDLQPDINGAGSNSVYASIFGKLENATVKNVTFEGATLTIDGGMSAITDIYVAPLAKDVIKSTVENVGVSMEYKVVKFPTDTFDKDNAFVVYSDNGYIKATESTINNLQVSVTESTN